MQCVVVCGTCCDSESNPAHGWAGCSEVRRLSVAARRARPLYHSLQKGPISSRERAPYLSIKEPCIALYLHKTEEPYASFPAEEPFISLQKSPISPYKRALYLSIREPYTALYHHNTEEPYVLTTYGGAGANVATKLNFEFSKFTPTPWRRSAKEPCISL